MLKGEFQFTNGQFVALGPKSYFSFDEDSEGVKMGSKGIPHSARLSLNNYLEALYGKGSHYVEMRSLRLNRKREMTRTTGTKRGLSDIFLKFRVADDGITCSPLMKNDEYLYIINFKSFQMWYPIELEALAKLYETKFDSNLEDVLYKNEIDSIKSNGTAWYNLENRLIVPKHNRSVI